MHAERMRQTLEDVLLKEVQCTESLLEALDAERSALIRRDVDALEIAVQSKLEHSQLLEDLDRQRDEIVSGMGFASDTDGMEKCFSALPGTQNLTRLWHQVIENIGNCQTGNLTNGGILESGRQQVEQVLRILRGQHGTPSLYNPHGETSADLGRRELGKV